MGQTHWGTDLRQHENICPKPNTLVEIVE